MFCGRISSQEYISKALLSTQIVRLQQCLTDIEFLRAKHYLILHDLGVIGMNILGGHDRWKSEASDCRVVVGRVASRPLAGGAVYGAPYGESLLGRRWSRGVRTVLIAVLQLNKCGF